MSIADMDDFEDLLDDVAAEFLSKMKKLFDEDPEIFDGRSTRMSWINQSERAADILRMQLDEVIGKVEVQLHNGDFCFDDGDGFGEF